MLKKLSKAKTVALTIAFGVSCQTAFADKGFTGMKLNENIVVEFVMPNSPAQKAGILRGDRIESVNNVPAAGKNIEQVANLITGPSGTKLSLVIVRGANRYKCDLVRGVSEATLTSAAAQDYSKGGIYTGLSVSEEFRIEGVDENSPAWFAGLRPGDQIEFVNGTNVRDFPESKEMLDMLVNPGGGTLNLRVNRGKQRFDVAFGGGRKPQVQPRKFTTSSPTIPVAPTATASASRASASPRTVSNPTQTPSSSASTGKIEIVVPIEIFRRTQYTDATEQQVRTAISKVPKNVQETVKRAGITIFIVPDMLSAHPEMNIEKPRGYHGGGYDNCGGMFSPSPKKIYICERVSWRNSPLQENWRLPATSLHEMGHAYDYTGSYSKAEEFVKAYEDDGKYLGSEQRKTWEYFLQENDAGRSEMFAELFVATISPSDDKRAAELSLAFPRCTKYLRSLLGK